MSLSVVIEHKDHKGLPWDHEVVHSLFLARVFDSEGELVCESPGWHNKPEGAVQSAFESLARKINTDRSWVGDWPKNHFPFPLDGKLERHHYVGYVHVRRER